MPEGPEVETIRRGLELGIVGQTILDVQVLFEKSFPARRSDIKHKVEGARVEHLGRRGKVLLIRLSTGNTLMVHLKMTGQMVLQKRDGERFAGGHPTQSMAGELPDPSTKAIFSFRSGDRLFFNDFRKFGWIKLVSDGEVAADPLISRMGPEALSDGFDLPHLMAELIRRRRSPIKAVILDQSVVTGVGNIYADECLHLARIHPARLAGSLSREEAQALHEAIKAIIALGVEHGGTSFSNYVNALGGSGDYLEHARAFRREGQPCLVHPNALIEKIRVAGRGTHICPLCQPSPAAAAAPAKEPESFREYWGGGANFGR